ncbi:DNA-3-methyladenine glycosylase [Nesterenkonia alkaliphila]|uniref:Putative 3-methyladenine DNA glycosylase n=1 Tax=Nesterenkonia alkaliphila TaxID=1463631 RepID=A0A7K1UFE6_9MICC|nr:DNA-3-methyladenine glycosylase [Nesterenkonia alkaliphila]MVT25152.1 DNA-3-methyladenine glycosylase [Nesterenkonia alkaliphila]GFZ96792.1 putative 3-methyladenine DNA glycosylase [Nesterenkonia alkaliphila]
MSISDLQSLFEAHPAEVAPQLLGCRLSVTTARGTVTVRLTEVEAYGDTGEDPGSHAFRGQTPRNATLFGPPRHTYVYRSYGIHFCLNLVAGAEVAGGILLRAGEVLQGRELAIQRRGGKDTGATLLSGPGRLGQGLGVTLPMDGSRLEIIEHDAVSPPGPNTEVSFRLAPSDAASSLSHSSIASGDPAPAPVSARLDRAPWSIALGPRVGVSGVGGSTEFPWRFWIQGDPTVSRYRPGKGVPHSPAPR